MTQGSWSRISSIHAVDRLVVLVLPSVQIIVQKEKQDNREINGSKEGRFLDLEVLVVTGVILILLAIIDRFAIIDR